MSRRLQRLVRMAVTAGALALSTAVLEQAAQACGHCGVSWCTGCQLVERTVMVPTMVPETRVVCATEYRCEVRERPVTVCRCVPETRQVKQTYTVMVPQVQTREEKCMVAVPVWEEVQQTYTVCVPQQEMRQGTRTVCKPVQVQETRTVCRDTGHWEETTCYRTCATMMRGCLGWFGCCGGCAVVACTQMAWVPNVVTEEVPVTVCKYETVEEPYQYAVTVYKQEQRTRPVKVCRYVNQERTRQVQYTVCVPQQRECVQNVTTYKMVAEQQVQKCTVMVPYTVQREVQVMVCKMVPQQVVCRVPVRYTCCR